VSRPLPYSTVQSRLDYVIANGLLPDVAAGSAKQVLERIRQPIRVVLLGLPGSGKSAVLNLLLGHDLIPDDIQKLPTLQVESGAVNQMVCVLPDGSRKTVPGSDLKTLGGIKPVFVTVEADFPALSKISLLDIVASDNVNEQRKAIAWASKRADVMIWCTTEFTDVEQDLWYEVPDNLKDHGLLLLTKTDLLAGQAEINTRLAEFAKSAGEEFLRIMPLSAKHALSIRASKANLNMAAFKATGASGLIAAVMSQIENNQRDAQDHAEQMLAHYCSDIDFSALESERPTPAAVADPDPVTESDTVVETSAETVVSESPASESATDDEDDQENTKADQAVLEQALARIASYENDLSAVLEYPDEWSADKILTACEQIVTELPEILGEESGPPISSICSDAFEIQDVILLMKNESGESSEDNAITLILQLRRDIETALVMLSVKKEAL